MPPTPTKIEPKDIAANLATLAEADLNATLAIMSGILQGVREGRPETLAGVKPGADALRLELQRWRTAYQQAAKGNGSGPADPLAALIAAGSATVAKPESE